MFCHRHGIIIHHFGALLTHSFAKNANEWGTRLKTSRSQVDRILDPKRDITLSNPQRAAGLVSQRVVLNLV